MAEKRRAGDRVTATVNGRVRERKRESEGKREGERERERARKKERARETHFIPANLSYCNFSGSHSGRVRVYVLSDRWTERGGEGRGKTVEEESVN